MRRCVAIAVLAAGIAQPLTAQDGRHLLEELTAERCSVALGQWTDDPHSLTRTLFEVEEQTRLNELEFEAGVVGPEPELWLGPVAETGIVRYLVFWLDGERHRNVACIPFHAMSSLPVEVDGRPAVRMTFGARDRTPRGYDMFTATYFVGSSGYMLHEVEWNDPFYYEKGIEEWNEPISDPWHWSEVRFAVDYGGTREHLWGFEIDLDRDGTPELGITSQATQGNGGGDFAFFRRLHDQRGEDSYSFLGYLGLKSLQVLPPAEDGSLRVRSFWHINADCSAVATHTNDGKTFEMLQVSEVCGKDLGSYRDDGDVVVPGYVRIEVPELPRN
jgi:hypothetical protein